jgi:chromosome partitioning protein
MATIISIANEKGGVAKTTTTISLGAAFAEAGKNTLIIDLDSQANLSLSLGLEPVKIQYSMANIFMGTAPVSKIIKKTIIPNLDLIPANKEMGISERLLPMKSGYENIVRKLLLDPEIKYDFILMDCPPFLGAVTLNALIASNLLIIPTQPEYFSIYALRNLMALIRWVRTRNNPNLTYRLLLTMFDRRNRVHRTLSDQLRVNFGDGVLQTVIEIDTKLRESSMSGTSIIQHAPKSRASAQYRALAQEILNHVQVSPPLPV